MGRFGWLGGDWLSGDWLSGDWLIGAWHESNPKPVF